MNNVKRSCSESRGTNVAWDMPILCDFSDCRARFPPISDFIRDRLDFTIKKIEETREITLAPCLLSRRRISQTWQISIFAR